MSSFRKFFETRYGGWGGRPGMRYDDYIGAVLDAVADYVDMRFAPEPERAEPGELWRRLVAEDDRATHPVELMAMAASGSTLAWPKNFMPGFDISLVTRLSWRVNRVGEIAAAIKQGKYNGRETHAFEGYYPRD